MCLPSGTKRFISHGSEKVNLRDKYKRSDYEYQLLAFLFAPGQSRLRSPAFARCNFPENRRNDTRGWTAAVVAQFRGCEKHPFVRRVQAAWAYAFKRIFIGDRRVAGRVAFHGRARDRSRGYCGESLMSLRGVAMLYERIMVTRRSTGSLATTMRTLHRYS